MFVEVVLRCNGVEFECEKVGHNYCVFRFTECGKINFIVMIRPCVIITGAYCVELAVAIIISNDCPVCFAIIKCDVDDFINSVIGTFNKVEVPSKDNLPFFVFDVCKEMINKGFDSLVRGLVYGIFKAVGRYIIFGVKGMT